MKNILVPVDFSAGSERQISTALLLAGPSTERIHFLHVEPTIPHRGQPLRIRYRGHHYALTASEQEDLIKGMVTETRARLDGMDLEVSSAMRSGIPKECILQEQAAIEADLLVLGSHGHHALYHFFNGATSLGLLEESPVPLVILPHDAEYGLPATDLNHILVACDFSDCTPTQLVVAEALAREHEANLHLLHVAPNPQGLSPEADLLAKPKRANWDDLEQHLQELKEGLSLPSEQVHLHLTVGSRTSVVLDFEAEVQADLICMGTHGHSALYDLLVGSVTEGVIEQAEGPVLVVPTE